jgi:hypothetical protein
MPTRRFLLTAHETDSNVEKSDPGRRAFESQKRLEKACAMTGLIEDWPH